MSKFQQRHYEAVASVIRSVKDDIKLFSDGDPRQIHGILKVEATLARMFKNDNGAFDADRFERACVPGASQSRRGDNVKART